jgi:hypothetical protein
MIDFKFPKPVHDPPLLESERDAFTITDDPPVWEWAEKNFSLTKAYVNPGKFVAHQWQREPLDAIRHYHRVYFIAPVQTGKSMMAEICCAYAMERWAMSGMLMYANSRKAEEAFKNRLRPAIEQIPILRKLWSGNDDDLTIKCLSLNSCIWGIASAQNKDDIASSPASFGYASECGKYKAKEFNPLAMLVGRQQASLTTGRHRLLFESSPWEVGDIFYREIYQSGTLILSPHVKCRHCKKWIVFTDNDIKEIGSDHDPAKIRELKSAAVRYECPLCQNEITEEHRCNMLKNVVWACTEINEGGFTQPAESITEQGEILGTRKNIDAAAFAWNRFVDIGYKFYEGLARFFQARKSPDTYRIYEGEDMARFWRGKGKDKLSGDMLRLKCTDYSMTSPIPDGVVIATCGIDTQDEGFYYVIRGYGTGMKTWLLRHGFVECSVKKEIYKKKETVLEQMRGEINKFPLKYSDERCLQIYFGFIDRGGHRPFDVDYLSKNISWLHAYIGSTRIDPKKPMVLKGVNNKWYLGQTQLLSELFAQYMEMDTWYLPTDIGSDYLDQVVGQYTTEEIDAHGQAKTKWVREKNDHYRDCENYNFAAMKILKLDEVLMQPDGILKIKKAMGPVLPVIQRVEEKKEIKKEQPVIQPFQRRWSR